MGSFNVSCSISNLSINEGDKIVFIPLINTKKNIMNESNPEPFMLSTCEYYSPLCLPIEGVYNGIGSVKNIKRTKSIEIIEKIYGMSIETFITNVTSFSNIRDARLNCIRGMYVLKEIYDELISFKKNNDSILTASMTENLALDLGFKKIEDNLYKLKNCDKTLEITGYMSSITNCDKRIFSLKDLLEIWKSETGINLDISNLKYKTIGEKEYEKIKIEFKELSSKFDDKPILARFCRSYLNVIRDDDFCYEYFFQIAEDTLKDEILDFLAFNGAVYSCNRFYFPAFNGEQDGNSKASKMLLKKSIEIIDKRLIYEKKLEDE